MHHSSKAKVACSAPLLCQRRSQSPLQFLLVPVLLQELGSIFLLPADERLRTSWGSILLVLSSLTLHLDILPVPPAGFKCS